MTSVKANFQRRELAKCTIKVSCINLLNVAARRNRMGVVTADYIKTVLSLAFN